MSLINDLLRDLDARHAPRPGSALSSGHPLFAAVGRARRSRSSLTGVLVVMLVAAGAGGWYLASKENTATLVPTAPTGVPAQKVPLAAVEHSPEVSVPMAPIAKTPAPQGLTDPTAIRLPGVPAAVGASREPAVAAQETHRSMPSAKPVAVALAAAAPAMPEPAVQNRRPTRPMAVARPVAARPVAQTRPAPVEVVAVLEAARPTGAAQPVRVRRVVSAVELDRQSVARAREAIQSGRPERAESVLQSRLRETPGAEASREMLAGMWLQQGRSGDAEAVLREGLQLNPAHPGFLVQQARILLSRNDAPGAVAALQSVPLTHTDTPEYLGMLAVTTQKLGDHAAATVLYRTLLERFPPQAKWWIGLAVSLEASHLPREAESAYQAGAKLAEDGDGLRRFAIDRLAALAQVSES